jgi:hypothetical protein
MTRLLLLTVLALALGVATASAHLCNNIYRTPDRIVVKPEKDVTSIVKADQFRVFVKNNYPTVLNNVRLTAKSPDNALATTVEPAAIPRMQPGEKSAFTLKITVKPGVATGKHSLEVGISANEVGFRPAAEASTESLRAVMKDDNPSPRVLAAESLVRRKDAAGYESMRGFIGGGDREYCCRALRAYGRTGDTSLADLVRTRLNDRDGFVKGNALLCLGMLGLDQQRINAFVNDRDPFVSTCARTALALQGDARPVPYLRPVVTNPNVWVRAVAAWGLAHAGDKAAVQVLDQSLPVAGDDNCKAMIGDALVTLAQDQRQ